MSKEGVIGVAQENSGVSKAVVLSWLTTKTYRENTLALQILLLILVPFISFGLGLLIMVGGRGMLWHKWSKSDPRVPWQVALLAEISDSPALVARIQHLSMSTKPGNPEGWWAEQASLIPGFRKTISGAPEVKRIPYLFGFDFETRLQADFKFSGNSSTCLRLPPHAGIKGVGHNIIFYLC